ncbi:hypothetical protein N7532_010371 [Penicillium argentinense]|uniref:Uncharacterized protein n=1 Tax=Penicillium argentinense TaxID=1131581 RepID=A0A9W9EPP9_9EURO|nr:uncharacterized protein N7532_010371 [Penicillium argentinense]KAJ5085600.1 hypothetical protein N7532_010371 [Penicillium argentinense]
MYPGELPAEIKANILQTPKLVAISCRIEKTLLWLRIACLKEHQNRKVRERQDQRILNRGKEGPVISDNDVSTRPQSLIMPEIVKISTLISSERELSCTI